MSQLQMKLDLKKSDSKNSDPKVLSISQVNRLIKSKLEGDFSGVWLQGEISNFKPHSSGHFYFSLKDKTAQISAVMFRGANSKLKFQPKVGMEVIVRGKISVYEPRGTYQILCDKMEPLGAGALQQAFEQLKTQLRKEGLFDQEAKKALPLLPKHVALVTSPTGAAVRDMLNVLNRRSKNLKITVVPCVVQGEAAPNSIIKALIQADSVKDVDAIIVGRGGGSMEDLWGFNNELLARTIYACKKPVISAVGHEIDFTISDFVADLRAPTPSAAAELVIENSESLLNQLRTLKIRLLQNMNAKIKDDRQTLAFYQSKLVDPRKYLSDVSLKIDDMLNRLELAIKNFLIQKKLKLNSTRKSLLSPQEVIRQKNNCVDKLSQQLQTNIERKLQQSKLKLSRYSVSLDAISPLKVVNRGYAIVKQNNTIVKEAATVELNQDVEITLAKGSLTAKVIKKGDSHEF